MRSVTSRSSPSRSARRAPASARQPASARLSTSLSLVIGGCQAYPGATTGSTGIGWKTAEIQAIYLCPGTESNCLHTDFQSVALPVELPGRFLTRQCLSEKTSVVSNRSVDAADLLIPAWGISSSYGGATFPDRGDAALGVGIGVWPAWPRARRPCRGTASSCPRSWRRARPSIRIRRPTRAARPRSSAGWPPTPSRYSTPWPSSCRASAAASTAACRSPPSSALTSVRNGWCRVSSLVAREEFTQTGIDYRWLAKLAPPDACLLLRAMGSFGSLGAEGVVSWGVRNTDASACEAPERGRAALAALAKAWGPAPTCLKDALRDRVTAERHCMVGWSCFCAERAPAQAAVAWSARCCSACPTFAAPTSPIGGCRRWARPTPASTAARTEGRPHDLAHKAALLCAGAWSSL